MRSRSGPGRAACLAIALLCSIVTGARSDTTANEVKLLRAPASPAFVLLGVEPSSVERPSSPKALGLSLASAAGDSNLIPSNYALETTPYWLVHHPEVDFDQLYKGFVPTLEQSAAFSIATARKSAEGDSVPLGSGVALGLRALLNVGWRKVATVTADSIHDLHRKILAEEDPDRIAAMLQELKGMSRRLAAIQRSLPGFTLEFAGGLAEDFPGNTFEHGKLGTFGLWLTPSYKTGDLMLLVVGRFIRDLRGSADHDVVDVGGRVLWDFGELSLSAEYVHRSRSDVPKGQKTTSRGAGIIEYKVSDDVYLSGTFGEDYGPGKDDHPLIAALGLSWMIGPKPHVIGESTGP